MNSKHYEDLRDRARVAFHRTLGNVDDMEKQLANVPRDMVSRLARKFRREGDYRAKRLGTDTLIHHAWANYEARVQILVDMLNYLYNKDWELLSACHRAPITHEMVQGKERYYCKKCAQECETITIDKFQIMDMRRGLVQDMERTLEALVKNAVDLGLAERPPMVPQNPVQINNNFLSIGGSKYLLAELDKADPVDRERIVKKLERQLLDLRSQRTADIAELEELERQDAEEAREAAEATKGAPTPGTEQANPGVGA